MVILHECCSDHTLPMIAHTHTHTHTHTHNRIEYVLYNNSKRRIYLK